MNPSIKINLSVVLIFAFSPMLYALTPAPDGGYPGANTAEGHNALFGLTTGTYNTAVGFLSLRSDTAGNFNTGIGAGTLLLNTRDSNTATGAGALLSNITGSDNTADGAFALFSNTASDNTAVGSKALLNNTTGGTFENIQGIDVGPNTAVGSKALQSNIITSANTAVGYQTLGNFTTGFMGSGLGANTAVGFQALGNATGGFANSGFGYRTLYSNTNGASNTAVGFDALLNNTTGVVNTAIGFTALMANTIGDNNTACGEEALANSSGNSNTAVGSSALRSLTTGTQNTALGAGAGSGVTAANHVICIGINGENVNNACYIGNIRAIVPQNNDTLPVVIDSTGQLGTLISSRRYKVAIKPVDRASESILALKPVSFRYKAHKSITPQFGLIAEDVAQVNPDLVIYDHDGKPLTVRYDVVNAMLLNEFLKEHRKVQQLEDAGAQQHNDFETRIAELKKEIASIVARSNKQDAKIQRVSARVEFKGPATNVVLDNR